MITQNRRNGFLDLVRTLCIAFAISALSSCYWGAKPTKPSDIVSSSIPTGSPQDKSDLSNKSRIRLLDFSNFEYSARPIYSDGEPTFRLKEGRFEGRPFPGLAESETIYLSQKIYADVTEDGIEEAILVLLVNVRGSAIPYVVYIYTPDDEKPRLLWSFGTGDRADGGLRRAYAADGDLIVELYGKGTIVNKNLKDEENLGACCPKSFTRTRYKWDGAQYRQKGLSEVIAAPNASGDLLPPP